MLSSPPLPIPHWNLNDQLSNHRTEKNHLTTSSRFYEVETEAQRSHRFLLAGPKCFLILCTGFSTGDTEAPSPCPPRSLNNSYSNRSKGFKILGSIVLGHPKDRQLESLTKDLEDKRRFPCSAFAQTAPPTGTPASSLSLLFANSPSEPQLRYHPTQSPQFPLSRPPPLHSHSPLCKPCSLNLASHTAPSFHLLCKPLGSRRRGTECYSALYIYLIQLACLTNEQINTSAASQGLTGVGHTQKERKEPWAQEAAGRGTALCRGWCGFRAAGLQGVPRVAGVGVGRGTEVGPWGLRRARCVQHINRAEGYGHYPAVRVGAKHP